MRISPYVFDAPDVVFHSNVAARNVGLDIVTQGVSTAPASFAPALDTVSEVVRTDPSVKVPELTAVTGNKLHPIFALGDVTVA